jgi:hypothetical protein
MSDRIEAKENVKDGESSENKKKFTEPKLKFVEPKLTKQGDATQITAGFLGEFSP